MRTVIASATIWKEALRPRAIDAVAYNSSLDSSAISGKWHCHRSAICYAWYVKATPGTLQDGGASFATHALERRCTVRSHGCARGGRRSCAIMRDVLAANLQLYPSAWLRSF